ncbi:MAG: acyl-ACP--UDP-N-acetylglucosamine O-acyltransferase [Planctomycetota bacterium]
METIDIHPSAQIAPQAELGEGVVVGPYAVIGPNVRIGARTRIGPLVVIDGHTTIGEDNRIVGQASIGGPPQDLSYRDEPTLTRIGDRNTIREFVSINRGTIKGGGLTSIGSDNLIMACCHVAHDCELEDKIVLSNGSGLAGHVKVCHNANVSGMVGAVHFVTIGEFAFVGGLSRLSHDVPPFMIVDGDGGIVRNLNVVGLQRGGVSDEDIRALRDAFKRIYRSGASRQSMVDEMLAEGPTNPQVLKLLDHLARTAEGLKGRYRESLREEFSRLGVKRIFEGEPI